MSLPCVFDNRLLFVLSELHNKSSPLRTLQRDISTDLPADSHLRARSSSLQTSGRGNASHGAPKWYPLWGSKQFPRPAQHHRWRVATDRRFN
ncbi:unnamed protein product [Protopolystoma xenopodis]|uniref:Uncharacterized protein n=1 Tax=Protopolystoma xenopodis TaxID=117903 RepID=A0A3S5CKW4_9PLAT|nr:unnamed protein product [Protopolystoma xenopodis]